jgi:hypothetical protein
MTTLQTTFSSRIRELRMVDFPQFTGERVYMAEIINGEPFPERLIKWKEVFEQMTESFKWSVAYLMVDEAFVKANGMHRRGGPHIDGNWCEVEGSHKGSSHGTRGHNRSNRASIDETSNSWPASEFGNEALLLASNVEACVAYDGDVIGDPMKGGDCSHLDLSSTRKVILKAGFAYSGNVTCVHESIPVKENCKRILIRINLPDVEI